MKVAPLMKRITEYNSARGSSGGGLHTQLVHTGQHYDEKNDREDEQT